MNFLPHNIRIDVLKNLYHQHHVQLNVARLDLLHPVISGNKGFKLKGYLSVAEKEKKRTILTFGGAYSNHIIATAAACKQKGFESIGIIRGEQSTALSYTLKDAQAYGMRLYFSSREAYKSKSIPEEVWQHFNKNETLIIDEGGYGAAGKLGAASILENVDFKGYSHIAAAVGTGTTLAGLISTSLLQQQVLGFSALKNNLALPQEINGLLPENLHNKFLLFHQFHFGGYAKHNTALISFMNDWYSRTSIRTDFVYTAKLFFGLDDLIKQNYFKRGSKVLALHSGGLQGNRSLKKGTLIFDDF